LAPSLCVKDEKNFHSSAVYASAIHSMSVASRFKPEGPISNTTRASGSLDIGEIVYILAGQDRQNMVAMLDVSMPAPPLSGILLAGIYLLVSVLTDKNNTIWIPDQFDPIMFVVLLIIPSMMQINIRTLFFEESEN
jgi:hypothetical protein